ncbi:hypothetical protein WKI65_43370 [Streptomyces sp. MS1.AVA.3]|uniref:hypothetical protein n=1 Tax=Streptomyces decoyicus TaxID=249567 RepID=UPI0030C62015
MIEPPAATGHSASGNASREVGDRLAELEALHRAATRGPWGTVGPDQPGILTAEDGRSILGVFGGCPQDEVDAQFAARAHQDVPFLLVRDAAHTQRIADLERALAAVTAFAEGAGIAAATSLWQLGYRAARGDLGAILQTTKPGVEPAPARAALFLAEYEGGEPELYTSVEAAKDFCADQLKGESPQRPWKWFPEEGGIFVQVYTSDLHGQSYGHAPGSVRRLSVHPGPGEGEHPQADLPHPHADALTTDAQGRPVCDGTRHRATRNCEDRAKFQLLHAGTGAVEGYACAGHLGQMVDTVNGGKMGSVLTRQIAIKE